MIRNYFFPAEQPSSVWIRFKNRSLWLLACAVCKVHVLDRGIAQLNPKNGQDLFNRWLDLFSIGIKQKDGHTIPSTGSLVILANHPFGFLEAFVLTKIISKVRPDFKFLANQALHVIPQIKDLLIPVQLDDHQKRKMHQNALALKACQEWLKSGHVLIVFPAGEVARYSLKHRKVMEAPWSMHIAKMIQKTQSATLIFEFKGTNSWLFHLISLLSKKISCFWLPREFLKKHRKTVEIQHKGILYPIDYLHLSSSQLSLHLRERCLGSSELLLP